MIRKDKRFMNEDGSVPLLLLKVCIEEHEKKVSRLKKLKQYDEGEHSILKRYLPEELPNNKMVSNHAEYISDISTGYVHGSPVIYSGPGSDLLNEHFTKIEEDSHNSDLGSDNSIYGNAYELVYMSEDGEPKLTKLNPFVTDIVCDRSVREECLFAFNYSPEFSINDIVTGYIIVVYTKYATYTYRTSTLKNTAVYELVGMEEHYFGDVPVTEYCNNKKNRGDFEGVITLIDAYNILQSDRINDKEQLADALLAVEGASFGDDEEERSETAKLIKKEKILELPEHGKAYWVVKTMNETQIEVLKKAIKDDIHEFSKVPCLTDENFVGNASGIAMKYKLFGLEQLGKTRERFFKRGLKRRLKLIQAIWSIQAIPFDRVQIDIVMKRSLPVDDEMMARIANDTADFISWETRVKRFDSELDPEQEKLRLQEERIEKIKLQQKAFGSYDFHNIGSEDE